MRARCCGERRHRRRSGPGHGADVRALVRRRRYPALSVWDERPHGNRRQAIIVVSAVVQRASIARDAAAALHHGDADRLAAVLHGRHDGEADAPPVQGADVSITGGASAMAARAGTPRCGERPATARKRRARCERSCCRHWPRKRERRGRGAPRRDARGGHGEKNGADRRRSNDRLAVDRQRLGHAAIGTLMTGMPSWRALSTRLPVMPEPGNAITPFGRKLSRSSLRRNGAALPWAFQSGRQMT